MNGCGSIAVDGSVCASYIPTTGYDAVFACLVDFVVCEGALPTYAPGFEACDALAPPPVCGNGLLELGESCDDGNVDDGDACPSACVYLPFVCADGSVVGNGDGCNGIIDCADESDEYPGNPECPVPGCGNGIIEPALNEECDTGGAPSTTCIDCRFARFECANGQEIFAWTTCDKEFDCFDGSDEYPQNAACPAPVCGDGIVDWEFGEECDDGDQNGVFDCDVDCTFKTFVCVGGVEIPIWAACDGWPNCPSGDDEGPENPDCPPLFTCDDGQPIFVGGECNGSFECADGSDEGPVNAACFPNFFCADGTPTFVGYECDAVVDCEDGSDEWPLSPFCDEPFHCEDGTNVPVWSQCDTFPNCPDGSDEYPLNAACPEPFFCEDGQPLQPWSVCDTWPDCAGGEDEYPLNPTCPEPFMCGDGSTLPPWFVCDGWPDCFDGTDEAPANQNCPPTFVCADGEELFTFSPACNALNECADGSDEYPVNAECQAPFMCANGDVAPWWTACDGFPNCADGSDEYPLNPECPEVPVASCEGACGGQSPSGQCWCDGVCHEYGDCCVDVCEWCSELPDCGN